MTNLREQMKAMGLPEELEYADRDAVMEIVDQAASDREWMARAERELAEARATIASVSVMLGWLNVPPRDTIEAHLRALRACVEGTEAQLASARAEAERLRELLTECLDMLPCPIRSDRRCSYCGNCKVHEKLRAALGQRGADGRIDG